jgi:hypothetical protein
MTTGNICTGLLGFDLAVVFFDPGRAYHPRSAFAKAALKSGQTQDPSSGRILFSRTFLNGIARIVRSISKSLNSITRAIRTPEASTSTSCHSSVISMPAERTPALVRGQSHRIGKRYRIDCVAQPG